MINDRFIKGVIGGASSAIIQNIYAYFARLFGFTNSDYLDVARAVLLQSSSTFRYYPTIRLKLHSFTLLERGYTDSH